MTKSEAEQLERQIADLEQQIARENSPYKKRELSRKLTLLKNKILGHYAEENSSEQLQ